MLLDDMVAERVPEPVAAPVITVEPVRIDDAVRGRGGRRRIADLENAARHNLRAAEEARRVADVERRRLEVEASIRVKIEREASALRRELERLRENEKLRVAQARYGAERDAREEVRGDVERMQEEHARVRQEMDRLRVALDDDRALMAELTDRLREEQQAKSKARADADKAIETRRKIERNLELATEAARRRAEDELARLAGAEAAVREAQEERERLAAEVAALTAEDGRLFELSQTVAQLESRVHDLRADRGTLAQQLDAVVAERDGLAADASRYEHELQRAKTVARDLTSARDALQRERDDLLAAQETARARTAQLEADIGAAHGRETELQARIAEVAAAREAIAGQASALETELAEMMAARDASARRVQDLEVSLAASASASANDGDAAARVAELERALSDEQTRVREADKELRRLRKAASADARAVATGRAEVEEVRAQLAVTEAQLADTNAQLAEPEPVATAEAEPETRLEPVSNPRPELEGAQRSLAMAELTALASSTEGEDLVPRRR